MTSMNKILILSVALVCAAGGFSSGCSGETSGGGEGGAGASGSGSGASGGGTSSTGSNGEGGAGGAGGTSGAGGAGCHGDAAAWETATAEPIPCETNSDCCVIVNSCINAARVVAADKMSAAKAAWPYCDMDCTDCIPPAVEVECSNKLCVGYAVPEEMNPPDELKQDHCGVDAPPVTLMNPKTAFSCGGG
jgi:hypothetical protein